MRKLLLGIFALIFSACASVTPLPPVSPPLKDVFNGGNSNGVAVSYTNNASGTAYNLLAKTTGAPQTALTATTGDTVGVVGVCVSGCGTTGSALIQETGMAPCAFDGATTAGDFTQISSTVAGNCHDTGSSTYPTTIGEVLGKVQTTHASGGTYAVNLFAPDVISSPGSGNGVPGGSQGQLQYNANGSTTFGGSKVVEACAFSGATADVQINAAVSALPGQGGVVDATCYGGTSQTIAATINVSGSNTKNVTLLIDDATTFNCTITNTTDCINVTAGSAVVGNHTNQISIGNGAFTLSAAAAIQSYFHLNQSLGFALENININPAAPTTGTVSKGMIWLDSPLQITYLKGININAAWNTDLIRYDNTAAATNPTGPVDMFEMNLGCNGGGTTCIPFQAKQTSSGFVGEINFYSSLMGQPSPGEPIVDLEGTSGGPIQDVSFYGTSLESKSVTDIGIFANNVDTVNIDGLIGTSGGSFGADLVKIAGATFIDNVHAHGIRNQGWTHTINNTITGNTIGSTHDVGDYNYETTGGNETLVLEASGGASKIGIHLLDGTVVLTPPQTLATYPTCTSSVEGSEATATNCSSTTQGTTCSGTGTTHARVYCNGSVWVQQGF